MVDFTGTLISEGASAWDLWAARGAPGAETFHGGRVELHRGDCLDVLRALPDCSLDSCVTDPPYALVSIGKRFGKDGAVPAQEGATGVYARASRGFMGKRWDTGERAFSEAFWAEVLRVLKPGAYVAAFGGTRTYHRLACAIEDAGFEIRDQCAWTFGSGFPKSLDISKAVDKAAGAERKVLGRAVYGDGHIQNSAKSTGYGGCDPVADVRMLSTPTTEAARQWAGWGTALKPAWEPICLARKPIVGTNVENLLVWGCGALNVDGCRVATADGLNGGAYADATSVSGKSGSLGGGPLKNASGAYAQPTGRWPANFIHDGSDEVLAAFPYTKSGNLLTTHKLAESENGSMSGRNYARSPRRDMGGDSGSAARFFYCAKASAKDRVGSKHPTVKPVSLMRWLVRLITPPGGTTLDPFAGSGTTGQAALEEGMRAVLVEREAEYQADIVERMRRREPSK